MGATFVLPDTAPQNSDGRAVAAGFIANDEKLAAGGPGTTTSTTSETFVDIGDNGSTGGFSDTSITVPVTGNYIVVWEINGLFPAGGTFVRGHFQMLVDGSAPAGQTSANTAGGSMRRSFKMTLTAGTHTFRLQWSRVGANSNGALALQGNFGARYIEVRK
jgi:hypothetical protein